MSQLDISISFSHLVVFLICFNIFIYWVGVNLLRYWYNIKLRSLEEEELTKQLDKLDNIVYLRKILKL